MPWRALPVSYSGPGDYFLKAITGFADGSAWAVGNGPFGPGHNKVPAAQAWDGQVWNVQALPAVRLPSWALGSTATVTDIAGQHHDDVWAVGVAEFSLGPHVPSAGGGVSWHWNGVHWVYKGGYITASTAFNAFSSIWRSSGGDLWAVGSAAPNHKPPSPLVTRWNGKRWVRISVSGKYTTLTDVSGTASDDVWVVGYRWRPQSRVLGIAMHWHGDGWDLVPEVPDVGDDSPLYAVAAIASNDVWAVGRRGPWPNRPLIFHWDGTQWADVPPTTGTKALNDVAGDGPTNVWGVGVDWSTGTERSLILRWNGTKWVVGQAPDLSVLGPGYAVQEDYLNGVAVRAGRVWAAGLVSPPQGMFAPLVLAR
jgi:hypothetical protein